MQRQPVPGRRQARGLPITVTLLIVAAVVAGWPSSTLAAPKTDVVVLRNGDRITGEIKSLDYNQLKLSTDHMGTMYIEWDKIERVQTDQYLLLERADGSRVYGQLAGGGSDACRLLVRSDPAGPPVPVDMADVVRAQPIEGGDFIDRLDGYVSAGLRPVAVRRQHQPGLCRRAVVAHADPRVVHRRQRQRHGRRRRRAPSAIELAGVARRLRHGPYYYEGQLGFTRNTQLELNLRSLVGGGLGRYFVRSNRAEWLAGVGLGYTHENYLAAGSARQPGDDAGHRVLDLPLRLPGDRHRRLAGVLPSLTVSGRYRVRGATCTRSTSSSTTCTSSCACTAATTASRRPRMRRAATTASSLAGLQVLGARRMRLPPIVPA